MPKEPRTPKLETALENRAIAGQRLHSPSAARNRDPIRDVFLRYMPEQGAILEIGGGTGEHAVHIAKSTPGLMWRTGDPDPQARASICAWIGAAGLPNVSGPHSINVIEADWGEGASSYEGILSINMIHIAPFEAATGLFAGAGRLLRPRGKLFLYGPFSRFGVHTSSFNAAFDTSLKGRDPSWGVRDLEQEILPLAQKNALSMERVVEMPANNFSVIFSKKS